MDKGGGQAKDLSDNLSPFKGLGQAPAETGW